MHYIVNDEYEDNTEWVKLQLADRKWKKCYVKTACKICNYDFCLLEHIIIVWRDKFLKNLHENEGTSYFLLANGIAR